MQIEDLEDFRINLEHERKIIIKYGRKFKFRRITRFFNIINDKLLYYKNKITKKCKGEFILRDNFLFSEKKHKDYEFCIELFFQKLKKRFYIIPENKKENKNFISLFENLKNSSLKKIILNLNGEKKKKKLKRDFYKFTLRQEKSHSFYIVKEKIEDDNMNKSYCIEDNNLFIEEYN